MPKSKLDVSRAVAIAPVIEGELEVTIDRYPDRPSRYGGDCTEQRSPLS